MERRFKLTSESMTDVDWQRWFVYQNRLKTWERLTTMFFPIMKQEPSRWSLSEVSYQAVGGCCLKKG